jgi:hypothetical protein
MTDARLKELEDRVTRMETNQAVSGVVGSHLERRLDKIESTLTWLVRLIVGAMITALLAFVLGGGLNRIGG